MEYLLAVDGMNGPEWRVLKREVRYHDILRVNELYQVAPSVIKCLVAKSTPPNCSLPIYSPIVTCQVAPHQHRREHIGLSFMNFDIEISQKKGSTNRRSALDIIAEVSLPR